MQRKCYPYPVEVVDGVFGESDALVKIVKSQKGKPRIFIAADYNVVSQNQELGANLGRYLKAHGIELAGRPEVTGGGEKMKGDEFRSLSRLMEAMIAARLGKDDIVLAIGGGTLLDLAGFAAAQVRGGLKLIRVPTTPGAMADGAFAEYAALNLGGVKDALRLKSEPIAVIIDANFLPAILDGVWRAGFGEFLRQAIAHDATLYKKLMSDIPTDGKTRDEKVMRKLLLLAVASRVKKGDTDFGKWSTQRFECITNYKMPHGYAVPISLAIDLTYAATKGIFDAEEALKVVRRLKACGALEGLAHSSQYLTHFESVLLGLESWRLFTGSTEVYFPTAPGKLKAFKELDQDAYCEAIKNVFAMFNQE